MYSTYSSYTRLYTVYTYILQLQFALVNISICIFIFDLLQILLATILVRSIETIIVDSYYTPTTPAKHVNTFIANKMSKQQRQFQPPEKLNEESYTTVSWSIVSVPILLYNRQIRRQVRVYKYRTHNTSNVKVEVQLAVGDDCSICSYTILLNQLGYVPGWGMYPAG